MARPRTDLADAHLFQQPADIALVIRSRRYDLCLLLQQSQARRSHRLSSAGPIRERSMRHALQAGLNEMAYGPPDRYTDRLYLHVRINQARRRRELRKVGCRDCSSIAALMIMGDRLWVQLISCDKAST